jgi:mRNA interferase MazF
VVARRPRGPSSAFVPERGDAIWLTFDPQAGREQSGRRPAVVISPRAYNAKTDLAIVCPITSNIKGYPFEVTLPAGLPIGGAVLSDHVRSLDWRARNATRICALPPQVVDDVLAKIQTLLTR